MQEHFQAKVYIDGQELEQLGLPDSIFAVEVMQDEFKSDMAIVDIWNRQKIFTDANIFRNRARMDVWIGRGINLTLAGSYILQKPQWGFPERDAPTIRLIGFDDTILLKERGERRRTFRNSTDSEIVSQVAAEYGLTTDVEATQERREQEVQLNETDIKFLCRLAKRNGYLLYTENKVLHFHPIRYQDTNLILTYGDGENQLVDFWPTKTLIDSAGNFISTFLDKDLGTVLTARSANVPDAVDLQDQRKNPTSKGVSSIILQRPTKYIDPIDTTFDLSTHQGLANRLQQRDSYLIGGYGTAHGNPGIKARQVVTIDEVGHLSGQYYIRSVSHRRTEAEGFMSSFFAVRARVGQQRRLTPQETGAESTSPANPGQEVQPTIIEA